MLKSVENFFLLWKTYGATRIRIFEQPQLYDHPHSVHVVKRTDKKGMSLWIP